MEIAWPQKLKVSKDTHKKSKTNTESTKSLFYFLNLNFLL